LGKRKRSARDIGVTLKWILWTTFCEPDDEEGEEGDEPG